MDVAIDDGNLSTSHSTWILLGRTFGQLCGLDQQISFLLRGRFGPRIIIAGAELTGVHTLQDQPKPPGVSPYHIGGCGLLPGEALIKSIGETVERYSQLTSEVSGRQKIVLANHADVANGGGRVISSNVLQMFTDDQYADPGFPFQSATADEPLAWVKAASLLDGEAVWVPAEIALLGHVAIKDVNQRRIGPAVTTGSAAHTVPALALRNALLELIQVDSAIGHWYSRSASYRIKPDRRTAAIDALVDKHFHPLGPAVSFYWLPNPDLPGLTVACLVRQRNGYFPAVALGLGIDFRLNRAIYKALLEAIGVSGLSRVSLLDASLDRATNNWRAIERDTGRMFDLDANVVHYGFPENAALVNAKFPDTQSIWAKDVPSDLCLEPEREIDVLVRAFGDSEKELVLLDLSTRDLRDLGFVAVRAWSPDTLTLPLPSAPPLKHPRFIAYGGARTPGPHPYA